MPGRLSPSGGNEQPWVFGVITEPELIAQIADIAYQNKAVIYDLLFKASAETTLKIAATPRHLGARIGFMSVLHTWGSALTHHPHVHMVVPGGGLSRDGSKWIACRPRYFLPVEVLSAGVEKPGPLRPEHPLVPVRGQEVHVPLRHVHALGTHGLDRVEAEDDAA